MNIYLTSGSAEFMESVRARYPNEMMVVMHGMGNSVLLHETSKKTVFSTPQRFKVIHSTGTITEKGYFALNHIPVTEEGRPLFEHQFKRREGTIEAAKGFIASRLLQPVKSDTYIILTQWEDVHSFNLWKNSTSYHSVLKESESSLVANKQQHIFTSAPYLATYKTKEDEE